MDDCSEEAHNPNLRPHDQRALSLDCPTHAEVSHRAGELGYLLRPLDHPTAGSEAVQAIRPG